MTTSTSSANAEAMPKFSRRSLALAAPAALIAATLPALADGGHPDAELLALREPYERTLAAFEAASPAHSRAEDAYYSLKMAHPDYDERTLRKQSGFVLAERIYNSAMDRNSDVIALVAATPAITVHGIAFKARISQRESNLVPDLVESIIADLVAMGGAHA